MYDKLIAALKEKVFTTGLIGDGARSIPETHYILSDSLEAITTLTAENKTLRDRAERAEGEMDAAVEDMTYIHCAGRFGCEICLNNDVCKKQNYHIGKCSDFDWRGNTKEDNDV